MTTDFEVPVPNTVFDGVLRLALLVGAVADLGFGLAALFAPGFLLKLVGVPVPENPAFLYLAGNVTFGLALTYLMGGLVPARYHANITIAALARLSGAAVIVVLIERGFLPWGLRVWLMAAAELLLGILHFVYSRRLAPAAAGSQ